MEGGCRDHLGEPCFVRLCVSSAREVVPVARCPRPRTRRASARRGRSLRAGGTIAGTPLSAPPPASAGPSTRMNHSGCVTVRE